MRRSALVALAALLALAAACDPQDVGVPEGKLAVVGKVALGPEELSSAQSQLGAYAQLRFSGDEGQRALLEALIAAELLAQEASDHGLADDPRVQWALYEEVASVYLSAALERRVPRQEIADDTEALRAYYEAHPEAFAIGEQRQARAVVYYDYPTAEAAAELLRAKIVRLEWLGDVVTTELAERDDAEHPGFHALLFDPALAVGDALPAPVLLGQVLAVAQLAAIEPPSRVPLEDPVVHEAVVQAVAQPRRAAAEAELRADLAQRYEAQAP
jgi:hypothetical protein